MDEEQSFAVDIYTTNYRYEIYCNVNYLECVSRCRRAIPGKIDVFLSKCLFKGDFKEVNFEKIKDCVFHNELIKIIKDGGK
jgi:hypothetical protein